MYASKCCLCVRPARRQERQEGPKANAAQRPATLAAQRPRIGLRLKLSRCMTSGARKMSYIALGPAPLRHCVFSAGSERSPTRPKPSVQGTSATQSGETHDTCGSWDSSPAFHDGICCNLAGTAAEPPPWRCPRCWRAASEPVLSLAALQAAPVTPESRTGGPSPPLPPRRRSRPPQPRRLMGAGAAALGSGLGDFPAPALPMW